MEDRLIDIGTTNTLNFSPVAELSTEQLKGRYNRCHPTLPGSVWKRLKTRDMAYTGFKNRVLQKTNHSDAKIAHHKMATNQ